MTDGQLDQIAAWYRAEYRRRTEAVMNGDGKIDWLIAEYRVSRTEVAYYAESIGIAMNAADTIQLLRYLKTTPAA